MSDGTVKLIDYIHETPKALMSIIKKSKIITESIVSHFEKSNVSQIIILGSGTSYHAGLSARKFMEDILNIPVRVQYPTLFKDQEKVFCNKTVVIGVSQGGYSKSTIKGIEYAKHNNLMTFSCTAGENTPLEMMAEKLLYVDCGDETVGAKTKGYLTTALTLMLSALEIGLNLKKINTRQYTEYIERMNKVIFNMPKIANASDEWMVHNMGELQQSKRLIVIGYDYNYGNTLEGSLKLLETLRIGVEGYEIEEFLHGIYNSIDQSSYVFMLANQSRYLEKSHRLYDYLKTDTENVYFFGNKEDPTLRDIGNIWINDDYFSFFEYIIPLWYVCGIVPTLLGIDPDVPKDPGFHEKLGSK